MAIGQGMERRRRANRRNRPQASRPPRSARSGRCRPDSASRVPIPVGPEREEPSLDTPNVRPDSTSSQRPKIAHGMTPEGLPHGSVRRSVRFGLKKPSTERCMEN
jgi:hypothetical protein